MTTKAEKSDLRTREGRKEEVLQQVRDCGGFSDFWVTANNKRASAAQRLIDSGQIVRCGGLYPWCRYTIRGEVGNGAN